MNRLFFVIAGLLFSTASFAAIKGYVCSGTEPFFSLDINATTGKMIYTSPENEKGASYSVTKPLQARGIAEGNVVVFKVKKSYVSAILLSSTVAGKTCSDGMSDNEYSYHLVYTNRQTVMYGCCEPKAQD